MNFSTHMVYSIVTNIDSFIKTGKERAIFTKCHGQRFRNANKGIITSCKRIYNDLENHYYTYEDLAVAILHTRLLNGKCALGAVNQKFVLGIKKLYTNKQIQMDQEVLKGIFNALDFNNPDKFFEPQEDGTNIIYVLTKKRLISLAFSVKYLSKHLTNEQENVIFNKEFKDFVHIVTKIKSILNRRVQQ